MSGKNVLLLFLGLYSFSMTLVYIDTVGKKNQTIEQAQDRADLLEDRLAVAEEVLSILFNEKWDADRMQMDEVTVTGYSSTKDQTDDTPFITANGEFVSRGGVALTDDLPIKYGQFILMIDEQGAQLVRKNDHTPGRKGLDLWQPNRTAAKAVGRSTKTIIWLGP